MKVHSIVSRILVVICLLSMTCAAGDEPEPEAMNTKGEIYPDEDYCRALIEKAIDQYTNVLTPNVRAQLIDDLKLRIAFGGRLITYPPSAIDLATGWDVIAIDSYLKAICEFTIKGSEAEDNKQVLVEILLNDNNESNIWTAKMTVSIRPIGKLVNINDLEGLNEFNPVPIDQIISEINQQSKPTNEQ